MRPFSYSFEKRNVAPSSRRRISLAVHARDLLREVGGERDRARTALLRVTHHPLGVVRADQHQVESAHAVRDGLQLDEAGLAHGTGVEGADLVVVGVRGADEAGCAGSRDPTDSVSTPWRSSHARYSSKSEPAAPTRTGFVPSCPMPKAMLAPTPPRRTSRLSTRKERETVCSWSATSWSAKRPGKSSGGRRRWSR